MGCGRRRFFGDSRLLSPFPGVTYTLDVRRTGQRPPAFEFARNNAKRASPHLFICFDGLREYERCRTYGTFFVQVRNKQVSLNATYGDKATMPSRFGVTTGLICPQN